MVDKENPEEYQKGQTAKKRLFEHVLSLAGTISGEHGVGITKAPYLSLELDETSLAIMQNIKSVFDPNNILNPGKIFDVTSDRSLSSPENKDSDPWSQRASNKTTDAL